MIDLCVPLSFWPVLGEDAVWFARSTWAELAPAEVYYDEQDMAVCMLRCAEPLYFYSTDAATGARERCYWPVQCGQLAAYDAQDRLLCLEHQAKEPA